ncbi:MAG: hypothetical protein C0499_02350 [Zymomonas sp.]|nr:hypothetical protein [Zymomonas sp.]
MTKKPTVTEYLDEKNRAIHAENTDIARSNRTLRATVAEQAAELEQVRQRLGLHERLEEARLDPPEWLTPKKSTSKHAAIPSLLLTDVHYDEVVKPEQIGGLNKYNRAIADQRIRRAFEGAIVMSRDYLSGVHYEGFNLFLGGDLLSGIIHEELRETNQAVVTESIVSVVEPLEAGITLLAEHFGKVHVSAVVGNHGRNTRKPRAKNRATDSFDWLVAKMVERGLKGDKRITTQIAQAADTHVKLYNHTYCLTHGDAFSGGSGISGFLSPLMLGVHRKAKRDAATGQGWDTLVMGHFHSSYFLKGLIVGGSVVGYSEFAYGLNLPYEEPQSAFWLTTPERGISVSAPIFLQDRKAERW